MRGLQVLEGAFNEDANMAEYVAKFHPNHPVGKVSRDLMASYTEFSPQQRVSVPILMFIDRKGMVQYQVHGGEPFFQPEGELKNRVREMAEKLVKVEGPSSPKKKK